MESLYIYTDSTHPSEPEFVQAPGTSQRTPCEVLHGDLVLMDSADHLKPDMGFNVDP